LSTWRYRSGVASTRDRLVNAAAELLDQGGPAAVTLREVGRLAGVSHNAPYKHFADKEELLAAVAAGELAQQQGERRRHADPAAVLRALLLGYVRWALRYPQRFKLTFGTWTTGSDELADAATSARTALVGAVRAAQDVRVLPRGDPERVTALVLALAHGAVDLELSGHLAKTGKGHADAADLVDDLLRHLAAARRRGA
jgi:AcrR family transcriptional regulator